MLREIFSGKDKRLSSKRIIGTICIAYAMSLSVVSLFLSEPPDVAPNVTNIGLQFLLTGAALIGLGVAEKGGK